MNARSDRHWMTVLAAWASAALAMACGPVSFPEAGCRVQGPSEQDQEKTIGTDRSDSRKSTRPADSSRDDAVCNVDSIELDAEGVLHLLNVRPVQYSPELQVHCTDRTLRAAIRQLLVEADLHPSGYRQHIPLSEPAVVRVQDKSGSTTYTKMHAIVVVHRGDGWTLADLDPSQDERVHYAVTAIELAAGLARNDDIVLPVGKGTWVLAEPGTLTEAWLKENSSFSVAERQVLLRYVKDTHEVTIALIDQGVIRRRKLLSGFSVQGDRMLLESAAALQVEKVEGGWHIRRAEQQPDRRDGPATAPGTKTGGP